MKRNILILFIFLIGFNLSSAQEKTAMLGLSASYEVFQNQANYYTSENTKGSFLGLEYSESKRFWGYRAGISYARIKDQTIFDFSDSGNLYLIDVYFLPVPSTLEIFDFPISGQLYLPLNPRIKLYANLGIMTSLAIFEDKTRLFYPPDNDNKSYSLRSILGSGISWQFATHFGLDFAVNQKRTLHTFNDNFRKPFKSLSFQTKVNYVF